MLSIDIENITCPLSLHIFSDPVIAEDGITYEREFIEKVFDGFEVIHYDEEDDEDEMDEYYIDLDEEEFIWVSPMTKEEFYNKTLIPNNSMKSLVSDFLENSPDKAKDMYTKENSEFVVDKRTVLSEYFLSYIKTQDFKIQDILDYKIMHAIPHKALEYIINNSSVDILETEDDHGRSLIHYICFHVKCFSILKLLVDKGADPDCQDCNDKTPIHHICHNWHNEEGLKAFRLLVDKGVNLKTNRTWSVIFYVCYVWHNSYGFEAFKILMEKNVSLERKCENNLRLIHIIFSHQNTVYGLEALKMLISKNISLECESGNGYRPIHYLCQSWKGSQGLEGLKLLLEKNVNTQCETKYGKKPIDFVEDQAMRELLMSRN